jgi:hypothetical protein
MAKRAVGKTFRVRVRSATSRTSGVVVFGVITRCVVSGLRRRCSTQVVQWRVTLNGEEHLVEQLPR